MIKKFAVVMFFIIILSTFVVADTCGSDSKYPNGSDCSYRGPRDFIASIDGSTQTYWLDMPDNFDSGETYPLIVYTHGRKGSYLEYANSPIFLGAFRSDIIILCLKVILGRCLSFDLRNF